MSGAVGGAIQGAAGGLPGAAVGAAKGAGMALLRDRRVQRGLLVTAGALVLVLVGGSLASGMAAASLLASVSSGSEENASRSAKESGAEQSAIASAVTRSEELGLPWTLVLALDEKAPEFSDFAGLHAQLDSVDPAREHRSLTAGAIYMAYERALTIPEPDSWVDGAAALSDEAAAVQNTYVTALEAAGLEANTAATVFRLARSWALGEEGCSRDSILTSDGGELTVEGVTLDAAQQANARIVIGVAKSMFGTDARAAAIIGLATAKVESGFRNYANDGVVGPEDGSSADPDFYAPLARSLERPHDAVGSDHTSLGVFQQQVSWGAAGNSTWASDPDGVIKRLMDPAFASGKFFLRLSQVEDWQAKEPGVVAQTVQVSAYPDRYGEQIAFAEALWAQIGAATPEVAVPEAVGWAGAEGSTLQTSCGKRVSGTWVWPIDTNADGTPKGYISSLYGWRIVFGRLDYHEGWDFAGFALNSNVYSIGDGTVVASRETAGCQGYVRVQHDDGTSTGYLHLNARKVQVGDVVAAGDVVGLMGGQTGCSTGVHLHLYTCDASGMTIRPEDWLAEHGLDYPEEQIRARKLEPVDEFRQIRCL